MIDNTFALSQLMGVGGSSKVYSAKGSDGNDYALKIIRKDKGYSNSLSKRLVENEFEVMSKLGVHPNLVHSLGYNSEGVANLVDGQHAIRYLVLEKCKNGSLSTIVRQTGPIEEDVTKFLFVQLCSALQHVHNKGFAHMDVKLENILLDDCFNLKLADLGTAVDVSEDLGFTSKRRGTPYYMAPEVQNKKPEDMIDATVSDVYSLGVCLYLMLTGEFPTKSSFEEESSVETETSGNISEPSEKVSKGPLSFLSDDAKDLLEDMLEENPFFRVSLEEVINHPWMKDFEQNIQNEVYLEMSSRLAFANSAAKPTES
jgi:serine/threonine protein kinase